MKPKKIKYAVLHFGYVESYGLSSLVLVNRGKPFTSTAEAKKSLADDLLAMYKVRFGITDEVSECCKANGKKKYCPECGVRIEKSDIAAEEFCSWLWDLVGADLNEVVMLPIECDREIVWDFGIAASELIGETSDTVLVLDDQGDKMLAKTLKLEGDD